MSSHATNAKGSLFLIGLGVMLLGTVTVGYLLMDTTTEQSVNETELEYAVHEKVNEKRAEKGLPALEFDRGLQTVAKNYSRQMSNEQFFGHVTPDGENFRDRYEAADYECNRAINETHRSRGGENLARTQYGEPVETEWGSVEEYTSQEDLAEGIVESWMNSTEHRENMLSENWARQGIGVHITEENAVYVTQNFC